MNGKTLEELDRFKYLGSSQTKDGTSVEEGKIRLTQAHSDMSRLGILRNNKAISVPTNIQLQVTCLVNTTVWMLELDVGGRPREANPGY